MGFLDSIFKSKKTQNDPYNDFWAWFQKNERRFLKVLQERGDIDQKFLSPMFEKLGAYKDGFYGLVGLSNDNTADLIFSAEGNVSNFVFVEELVNSAPPINGWVFTALKPALDIKDVNIAVGSYNFTRENMWFFADERPDFPDEVAITVVYADYNEDAEQMVKQGVLIFLDNLLGEANFAASIDEINIVGPDASLPPLIPIEKLKDYLVWREKEFIEKYEGVRHNTDNDKHSIFEGQLKSGNPMIAVMNVDLLQWSAKASHPWMMVVVLPYNGARTQGMPDKATSALLEEIENELLAQLKDSDGYLNIGRDTANGVRQIYFACKDYRLPSKTAWATSMKYKGKTEMKYELYKDKYWRTLQRFNIA